jgi:outer membrane protein OmpA-like peptidoglycan-associated protein
MATNLLDLAKGYLTPDVIEKAASFVGESGSSTSKAFASIIPTLLAALANLGSTSGGVQQVIGMLESGKYDGSALASPGGLFGGGVSTQSAIGAGKGILESLFGSKLGGVTDLIARSADIRPTSAGSLMAVAAPLVMNVLGRERAAAGGGAASLGSLLGQQKTSLSGLLPAGLASMLGWPGVTSGLAAAGSTAAGVAARTSQEVAALARSDWWIPVGALAALILLALGYLSWGTPVGQISREASRKLAELQLPGGFKISVPEGAFNYSLASWLASTTDTAVPKRFVFDNLNFETGSTQLTPESRPTVDSLIAILKAYPPVAVVLEGHTDNTGDAAANKKLSLDRAAAVKDLLVAGGVAESRVNTAGFGSEKPISSNDTEDGRAKNRRLELVVEKR